MVLKSCPPATSTQELAPTPPPTDSPPPASRVSGQAGPRHEGGRSPRPTSARPAPMLQVTDKTSAHLPHQAGGRCT